MNTKSIVCTKANQLMKEGNTRSAAFVKAWALVKTEQINNRLFDLNMIDRQSREQKEEVRKLQNERRELQSKAGKGHDSIKAHPISARIINPDLTNSEKAEIEDKLFRMMTTGIYDDTFNMDEYKALEAQLYAVVRGVAA
jgi:hypothetical protein